MLAKVVRNTECLDHLHSQNGAMLLSTYWSRAKIYLEREHILNLFSIFSSFLSSSFSSSKCISVLSCFDLLPTKRAKKATNRVNKVVHIYILVIVLVLASCPYSIEQVQIIFKMNGTKLWSISLIIFNRKLDKQLSSVMIYDSRHKYQASWYTVHLTECQNIPTSTVF